MSDPKRLLDDAPSSLERDLLVSVVDEPLPSHLGERMATGFALALSSLTVSTSVGLGVSEVMAAGLAAQSTASAGSLSSSAGGASSAGALGVGAPGMGAGGLSAGGLGAGGLGAGAAVSGGTLFKSGLFGLLLAGSVGGVVWSASSDSERPAARSEAARSESISAPDERGSAAPRAGADERLGDPSPVLEGAPLEEEQPSVVAVETRERHSSKPSAPPSVRASGSGRATDVARSSGANAAPGAESPTLAAPGTDVGAEVRLLDAARRAIAVADLPLARAKVREYEERFPEGVLRSEAMVLRRAAEAR